MAKRNRKFALGDIVEYSNKRSRINMTGQVIAYEGAYCCVETLGGEGGPGQGQSWFWKNDQSDFLAEKFVRNGSISNSYIAISDRCQWLPSSSKNLVAAMRDYDPTQAGDQDDDI